MDILEIDNLMYENNVASLKISEEGMSLLTQGNEYSIQKNAIKMMSVTYSVRDYCLRIITEDDVHDLLNLHESFIKTVTNAAKNFYNIMVEFVDLEVDKTTHGNLVYSNSVVYLQGKKEIFSVPKSKIEKIIELENEIEFHLPGTEIIFTTSSNILQFLDDNKCEEICIMNNVNSISPRSRTTLIFYSEYFVFKGPSYDHSVFYDSIKEIFFLERGAQHYLVLKLSNYIVQGQTRYSAIVFLLSDKETEVAVKPTGTLKSFYKDSQHVVLLNIIESLTKLTAQESSRAIKCTNKINEGYLYLMEHSIQFLPKLISLDLSAISQVEFLRINLSLAQAKTFDMIVYSDKTYNFNSIPKEFFTELEMFFTDNKIRIISEVIEESLSTESTEDDVESDISDLVNSESE